jgi:Phospholipid-translocating P-type ATPase C-terminal
MITHTWTRKMVAAVAGSVLVWFVFVLVYSDLFLGARIGAFYDFFFVGIDVLRTPATWISLPLVVVCALAPDAAWHFYRRMYAPTVADVIREWESGHGTPDGRVLDAMEGLPPAPEHVEHTRPIVRCVRCNPAAPCVLGPRARSSKGFAVLCSGERVCARYFVASARRSTRHVRSNSTAQGGGRLRSVASSALSVSNSKHDTSNVFKHHAAQMKDLQTLQRAVCS